ncbi:hypothetical protein ACGIF2_02790 [Cellulomonas sp. P22]|uniref:hypothetical protein n=1 Tax=Cellulomonas sp. P22 TaxID=3373189 RepID=UPI00379F9795
MSRPDLPHPPVPSGDAQSALDASPIYDALVGELGDPAGPASSPAAAGGKSAKVARSA